MNEIDFNILLQIAQVVGAAWLIGLLILAAFSKKTRNLIKKIALQIKKFFKREKKDGTEKKTRI